MIDFIHAHMHDISIVATFTDGLLSYHFFKESRPVWAIFFAAVGLMDVVIK